MDRVTTGAVAVSAAELDMIIYYREFKEWYSALSAPARKTLALLPTEDRLSIADRAVRHRLVYGVGERAVIARPVFKKQRYLIAA